MTTSKNQTEIKFNKFLSFHYGNIDALIDGLNNSLLKYKGLKNQSQKIKDRIQMYNDVVKYALNK